MIADMAADLSAARLLTRHGASLKDRGLPSEAQRMVFSTGVLR